MHKFLWKRFPNDGRWKIFVYKILDNSYVYITKVLPLPYKPLSHICYASNIYEIIHYDIYQSKTYPIHIAETIYLG